MGIFYLFTVLIMIVTFTLFKKSNEKLNIVSMLILAAISYLGFNILVCMIFGNLGATTNLTFLSIMNLIVAGLCGFKIFKDKTIQKFKFRIFDLVMCIIILLITCYISVKQYTPLSDTIANASVDASMHYSAATHFADNMKVLSKIDNKTGYNFKTMQTGAYINTGILMAVARSIVPQFKDFQTFKIFEVLMFTLNNLVFYMLIADRIAKKKSNYIAAIVFTILYSFAYTYTSLLYGFSYLSVSIGFATMLFYLANMYEERIVSTFVVDVLIVIACTGIIFSYCLFVPALFSFICIYIFIVDSRKLNEKSYLKFFKKNTIIMTVVLLIVTVLSILYLVVPTITDADQNKLTDAIGFVGQTYIQLFVDFVFYIPFVIFFVYKDIKNKKVRMETVACILVVGQTALEFIGAMLGYVSAYYYYKIYFIIFILFAAMAVDVFVSYKENKELGVMLWGMLALWCFIIYGSTSGMEIKIQQKSPMMVDAFKMQTLSGIYYDSNIATCNNINVSCIVDANRVKMGEAMGKIEGITLKNTLVGGMNTTHKAWLYVISGIDCGGQTINDLQVANVETSVEDFLKDDEKEFFVLFTSEEYKDTDDYTVEFENEAGVILKKVH